MNNPNIEYEICLSGNISLKNLMNWKHLKLVRNSTSVHKSKYFDDDKFSLINNSLGLRIRKENLDWIQTLKFERLDQKRLEWNSDVIRTEKCKYPKINYSNLPEKKILHENGCQIRQELKAIFPNLKEQFTVILNRISWSINYLNGKIDLSFDSGHLKATSKKIIISELELELKKGEPYLVWLLAKEVLSAFPNLKFEYKSKALRGYLLNGIDWKKLPKSNNYENTRGNRKFEEILRNILLQKIKIFCLFFDNSFGINKNENFNKISQTLTEIRYIFQLLIFLIKNTRQKNIKIFISFKYRCTELKKEFMKINKMDSEIRQNFFIDSLKRKSCDLNLSQMLIADLGLFANDIPSSLRGFDHKLGIEEFSFKFHRNIVNRKNMLKSKTIQGKASASYNIITFNKQFLISLGIERKLIEENEELVF